MKQLMFDNEFKSIVEDNHIWTIDEISDDIRSFIKNKSDSKMIYDIKDNKYYCSNCFQELSKNYYCKKCHRKISDSKYFITNIISIDSIYDEISSKTDFYYYVFDTQDEKLLLYVLRESVYLYRTTHLIKVSNISIDKVFIVNKESLKELFTNKEYSYHDLMETIKYHDKLFDEGNYELLDSLNDTIYELFLCDSGYVYTKNISLLKNTIYNYSYIWDTVKYLANNDVSLYEITCLPLTDSSFEYYVKYGLYTLAYDHRDLTFKKSFKNTFGVDKKYLPFMVKNDINYHELLILRYTNNEDIKLLRELSIYSDILKELKNDFGLKINKVIDYFNKKHYKYTYLYEYRDYISMCNELKYNLKDKKTIYPEKLLEVHNKVFKEYELVKDKVIENNIINISKVLEINRYEDNDYVIYPAPTLDSMIDESFNQNNCLKTYCKRYSNGETNIYFMRKKNNINKSLVTIEVIDNKVAQARIKNNKLPDYKLMNIINNWEKKLIPIEFENYSS